jgi:hypothetical protein
MKVLCGVICGFKYAPNVVMWSHVPDTDQESLTCRAFSCVGLRVLNLFNNCIECARTCDRHERTTVLRK